MNNFLIIGVIIFFLFFKSQAVETYASHGNHLNNAPGALKYLKGYPSQIHQAQPYKWIYGNNYSQTSALGTDSTMYPTSQTILSPEYH